tara:strand:- start:219 stop:392 length:174 start_codon:yes stop_codon:yes gene_type:complete
MKKTNVKSYFATIVTVFATSGLIVPQANAEDEAFNRIEQSSTYVVADNSKCGKNKDR